MNKTTLDEVKRQYPNDFDLGKYIRFNFMKIEELNSNYKIDKIIDDHPNDFDLGKYIRAYYP